MASAPAFSALRISSARFEKSAERIDGAILTLPFPSRPFARLRFMVPLFYPIPGLL
jgi:hypothetical protein